MRGPGLYRSEVKSHFWNYVLLLLRLFLSRVDHQVQSFMVRGTPRVFCAVKKIRGVESFDP